MSWFSNHIHPGGQLFLNRESLYFSKQSVILWVQLNKVCSLAWTY